MLYPLTRMMWGENGNWDKASITPTEPGAGYPIRVPNWITYGVSFIVKSKIMKDFILNTKVNSLIRNSFEKDLFIFGKIKKTFSKEFSVMTPKFARLDMNFNLLSSIQKDYKTYFNIKLSPSSKKLQILNLLNYLNNINSFNYVDFD